MKFRYQIRQQTNPKNQKNNPKTQPTQNNTENTTTQPTQNPPLKKHHTRRSVTASGVRLRLQKGERQLWYYYGLLYGITMVLLWYFGGIGFFGFVMPEK